MIRSMTLLLGTFAMGISPASAQEVTFSSNATESCLASGKDAFACAGASAQACIDDTPGGYSTVGMGACLHREWEWWDERLNLSYGFALQHAKKFDVDNGGFSASQEEALREMQRAWITFRDRKCDYVRSHWGGGTGGGPASVECLMTETAQQTEFIEMMVTPG